MKEHYVQLRELGVDKFIIEVIEIVECNIYERKHIDELKPVFNYQRAQSTEVTRKADKKERYDNKKTNMTEAEKKPQTLRGKEWKRKTQKNLRHTLRHDLKKKKKRCQENQKGSIKMRRLKKQQNKNTATKQCL